VVRRALGLDAASVVVLDDLSSGYEWLLPVDPRLRFIRQDVCRLPDLQLGVRRPIVFHLAAFFANQNSVDHPLDDLHTNAKGTLTTLIWAQRERAERLVYASAGCSIAGHGIDGPIREDMPVSLHLDTPYQITKAVGEFYCNYFVDQVSTVRCRFFNSYGPGEVPGRYRNVIPNFIWLALNGRPLVITGTGEETRDFIFVDDLVDGLIAAATVKPAHGQALNLGTGVQTRIEDLAHMVIDACGSSSHLEYAPRRSWDRSAHRQADISRASLVLGFSPSTRIRDGIERTVSWFRANHERIAAAIGSKHVVQVGG
jgi:nucleoside-diphosphate-sugar epimerase